MSTNAVVSELLPPPFFDFINSIQLSCLNIGGTWSIESSDDGIYQRHFDISP